MHSDEARIHGYEALAGRKRLSGLRQRIGNGTRAVALQKVNLGSKKTRQGWVARPCPAQQPMRFARVSPWTGDRDVRALVHAATNTFRDSMAHQR